MTLLQRPYDTLQLWLALITCSPYRVRVASYATRHRDAICICPARIGFERKGKDKPHWLMVTITQPQHKTSTTLIFVWLSMFPFTSSLSSKIATGLSSSLCKAALVQSLFVWLRDAMCPKGNTG